MNRKLWYLRVCVCVCVCVCLSICLCVFVGCVCVNTFPLWRLSSSERCLRRTWEVRTNDVILWVSFQVPLTSPSSLFPKMSYFASKEKLQLTGNWRENDVWYMVWQKDHIYWYKIQVCHLINRQVAKRY